ncbi:hypothetical protein FS837_000857, partial [Tulasnella sp. UAMH 9824]
QWRTQLDHTYRSQIQVFPSLQHDVNHGMKIVIRSHVIARMTCARSPLPALVLVGQTVDGEALEGAIQPMKKFIYARIVFCGSQANVLEKLGAIHRGLSRNKTAEEFYVQARGIYNPIRLQFIKAGSLDAQGATHRAQSNHGEAEHCVDQVRDICASVGLHWSQPDNSDARKDFLHIQSAYSQAEEHTVIFGCGVSTI